MGIVSEPSRAPSQGSAEQPDSAPADPYARIVSLARGTTSRPGFLTETLRCIVSAFGSPYGAIHVRYASEVLQDDSHTGPTDPGFWKPSLQQFLTESLAEGRSRARLLKAKSGDTKVAFLSGPIFDPAGPAIGALAVVVTVVDESEWTARLSSLEALCRLASFCTEFVGRAQPGPEGGRTVDRAMGKAAACGSVEELAFAITNELRNKMGFEQVALSTVDGKSVRVVSISGLDQVNRRSPGVSSLRAAMEECLDAGESIVYQPSEDWTDRRTEPDYHLHRQWHLAAKGDGVASIPLKSGDEVVAILSLRSPADEPFTRDKVETLRTRIEPLAPALALTRRASRGLFRHTLESTRTAVGSLTTPGRLGRKIAAACVAAAVVTFCFGSMDYNVTAPCTVAPEHVRHISAPFAGLLTAAYALQGDRVRAGDVLAELDHRDLDQQRIELAAQWRVYEREQDRAMAADSPIEVQLALASQELVRAKLDIVDSRIERAVLRAPFDGTVVWGDLRKQIGIVVEQGDPLFQVASPDGWKLELEVPEAAAEDLVAGLSGSFASFARPEQTRGFQILRVHPTAELRRGKNVFVAEARIDEAEDWIRPGMEGVAGISMGRRPIWWVSSHRIIDFLRLHLWL